MAAGETLEVLKVRYGAGKYLEANGARFHYARMGPPGAPKLVLLHGWPEFWLTWRRNLPVLAERYDVIVPDIRGFGESRSLDRPADAPLPPEQVSDDLAALLDALGIARIGLVAHDVGATCAQAFARAHPDHLVGLFTFNCPHHGIGRRWASADAIPECWYQYFHQTPVAARLVGRDRHSCRDYLRFILGHWSHNPDTFDDDLDLWVDNFLQPGVLEGGFAWYNGVDAARRRLISDGPPDLPRLTCPTRVLWGRSDKVLRPDWTDTLGMVFADLRAVDVVDGAGHFVHYEVPDLANREILKFFSEIM